VEGRERSLSVINDERDLHIDLAQNTLQSRLVQHLVTSTSSPTKISLSFFIHLSLTSARDTKKQKKLAGFRWLAGLRFVEVCINAYLQPLLLQPDVKSFRRHHRPPHPRASLFSLPFARERGERKRRERERDTKKKSERSSSAAIKAISHRNAQKKYIFYASSLEQREREKTERDIARARGARNSFVLAHPFFFFYTVFCIFFSCIFVTSTVRV